MKVKSESEVAQLCPTLSDPMDYSPPASSIIGFSRREYWSGVPLRSWFLSLGGNWPPPRDGLRYELSPVGGARWSNLRVSRSNTTERLNNSAWCRLVGNCWMNRRRNEWVRQEGQEMTRGVWSLLTVWRLSRLELLYSFFFQCYWHPAVRKFKVYSTEIWLT